MLGLSGFGGLPVLTFVPKPPNRLNLYKKSCNGCSTPNKKVS